MVVENILKSKLPRRNRKRRKTVKSKLMKAACAGLLSAGLMTGGNTDAKADIFDETSIGDFSDDNHDPTVLPSNIREVFGANNVGVTDQDYFEVTGLVGGTTLQFNGAIGEEQFDGIGFTWLDSSLNSIAFYDSTIADSNFSDEIIVPNDGVLIGGFEVTGETGTSIYNLAWSPVPEPSTGGLLALGAAGLLGRRRRKSEAES